MPKYMLTIDRNKCDGCRLCEMVCSLIKTNGLVSPIKARIKIRKNEPLGIDFPIVCFHCENPPCMVCPVDAMFLDEKGIVKISEEKCTGCKQCLPACQFGAIFFDPDKNIAIKCDLCGEHPACVKICKIAHPPGVVVYTKPKFSDRGSRKKVMERLQMSILDKEKASVKASGGGEK